MFFLLVPFSLRSLILYISYLCLLLAPRPLIRLLPPCYKGILVRSNLNACKPYIHCSFLTYLHRHCSKTLKNCHSTFLQNHLEILPFFKPDCIFGLSSLSSFFSYKILNDLLSFFVGGFSRLFTFRAWFLCDFVVRNLRFRSHYT